jgi:hypothetical protein
MKAPKTYFIILMSLCSTLLADSLCAADGVGRVCIGLIPVGERWDANRTGARESSAFTIQIDKLTRVLVTTNVSGVFTNLSLAREHLVKIRLDGKPPASFRFSFKGRGDHLRLWYNPFYGSWSLSDVRPGENCACPKATPNSASQQTSIPQSLRPLLQRIESVDVNMDHYPSYSQYHDSVYQQVRSIVAQVSSPSELKALFVACAQRWKAAPEKPQERLQWMNPHFEACNAVVFRLAKLDSEEATEVLVGLYSDETFGWDGEFALNAANAISRCGKRAVPHLLNLVSSRRKATIQELVACINKGELYGP